MKTCRNEDCPDPGQAVYPDDASYCPRCGVPLEPATDEEVEFANRPKLPDDFECAAKLVGAAQVAVAKSLLDSAEIEFYLTNEITQDFLGWGQLFSGWNLVTGSVGVWVHHDDAADVATLLAELSPDQPEARDEEANATP
jgi:hypothetical protein